MRTLGMRTLSLTFAAGLLWVMPACAADPPPASPAPSPPTGPAMPVPATPGEQARQGLDLLMKALEGWVRQMPLFAPPEVTPEGDIIIRRLDRNRPVPPPATPGSTPPGAPTKTAL